MRKLPTLILVLAAVALLGPTACRQPQEPPAPGPSELTPSATPSTAEIPPGRTELGSPLNPVKQIVVSGDPAGEAAAATLDELLAEQGVHSQSFLLPGAVNAVRNLCDGSVGIAWLPPAHYVAATQRCPGVYPLLRLTEGEGPSGSATPFPGLDDEAQIRSLAQKAPGTVIVAGPAIPPELAAAFTSALQTAAQGEAGRSVLAAIGGWSGVAETSDSAFDPLRQALTDLDIDVETWQGVGVPFRIGLVTSPGSVDEGTANRLAYEGLSRMGRQFDLEYATIETVRPDDLTSNVEQFVRQGYDLVIVLADDMTDAPDTTAADAILGLAQENPEVSFALIGFNLAAAPDNVQQIGFRDDQAGFLAGALAGQITQSRTVGFVGGAEGPITAPFRQGYENGVGLVCPDCQVLGVYIDSFTDPGRGTTAALSQIGEGADVIFAVGGSTASGALQAAAQDGVFVIGGDHDHYLTTFEKGRVEGAERLLSSVVRHVDTAVAAAVQALLEGTFAGGTTIYGAAEDGLGLAPFRGTAGDVPEDVKAQLDDMLRRLGSGELPTGADGEAPR